MNIVIAINLGGGEQGLSLDSRILAETDIDLIIDRRYRHT